MRISVMDGSVSLVCLLSHYFHAVNLATSWPLTIYILIICHKPECRKVSLSLWNLCTAFKSAVGEGLLILCWNSSWSVRFLHFCPWSTFLNHLDIRNFYCWFRCFRCLVALSQIKINACIFICYSSLHLIFVLNRFCCYIKSSLTILVIISRCFLNTCYNFSWFCWRCFKRNLICFPFFNFYSILDYLYIPWITSHCSIGNFFSYNSVLWCIAKGIIRNHIFRLTTRSRCLNLFHRIDNKLSIFYLNVFIRVYILLQLIIYPSFFMCLHIPVSTV